MDYDPRRTQFLERTRCAITFEGFRPEDPVPLLGCLFELWKELAIALEAQFPDPYRLIRALQGTNAPLEIAFLWNLRVHPDGNIQGKVERCTVTPFATVWDVEFRKRTWGMAVQAGHTGTVSISERGVYYPHVTHSNAPDSVSAIACRIATELRLPNDPPEYTPAR